MVNKTAILILCFLFSFSFTQSQSLQVDYEINKTEGKGNSFVKYSLSIDGNKSVFFPQNKCIPVNTEESIIPLISSEVLIGKDSDTRIYDKIGRVKVYYLKNNKELKWNITKESKIENNYTLKKAITIYNNKEWIAWFIEDIPIPEGPYIFKNLPGLIYSINDIGNTYLIRLTAIKNNKSDCNLDLESYKEISYEKYTTALETSLKMDRKLLESLMSLELPKNDLEALNKKITESNILRGL